MPFDSSAAAWAFSRAKALASQLRIPLSFYPLVDPDEAELADWFAEPASRNFFAGCEYIRSNLRIDPEGYAIPCMEHRMGSILTQDLTEIWTGARYRLFRELVDRDGPFRACLRCCNLTQAVSA